MPEPGVGGGDGDVAQQLQVAAAGQRVAGGQDRFVAVVEQVRQLKLGRQQPGGGLVVVHERHVHVAAPQPDPGVQGGDVVLHQELGDREGGDEEVHEVAGPDLLQVGQGHALQAPLLLPDRLQIRQPLAGVREIAEGIHHGHIGCLGKTLDAVLTERPDDYRVDIAGQDASGVFHGLAAAELQFVPAQDDRVSAHRRDRRFEGDAGPGRGLLEDEGDLATLEPVHPRARLPLDLGRGFEDRLEIARAQVVDREEVVHDRSSAPTRSASADTIRSRIFDACSSVIVVSGARSSSE